jgi:hypothetical protein
MQRFLTSKKRKLSGYIGKFFVQLSFPFKKGNTIMTFNKEIYLAQTPAARAAIAKETFATALEYYNAIGRFQEDEEGIFDGTNGNDIVIGYGLRTDLYGVKLDVEGEFALAPESPFGLSGMVTYIPKSLGMGEIDLLVGKAGTTDEFFFGSELEINIDTFVGTSVPLYVGMGDRDYGIARNFSAADGDIVILAGAPKDYLYETVNGNFEIKTQNGDLVGVVEGVSSLGVQSYFENFNLTILQGGDVPGNFNEQFYLGIFPDVRELVEAGVFESGLDHYQAYGQYIPTENKYQEFVTGTNSNDTLIGFGTYEVDYFPVAMSFDDTTAEYGFASLGVGEIDTIVAVPGIINEFILSSFPTAVYDTAEQFYVGNKDADYARIQNLKNAAKGEFYFIGKREDFLFEDREGDVRVFYQGDLVTIIEGIAVSDLQITDTYQYQGFDAVDAIYEPVPFEAEFQQSPVNTYDGSIYLRNFDEDVYLAAFPTVAQDIADGKYEFGLDHYLKVGQFQGSNTEGTFTGSSDSDIVLSFGAAKLLWGIGATATIDENIPSRFNIVNDSLGERELDILVGSDGINEFQLTAYNYVDFAGSADSVPLYVGGGDSDYAVVRNFKDGDSVVLSGNPADYKYGVNNGNFEIFTLDGDLVGIVEDIKELQVGGIFDTFEVFELVSSSAAGGFDEDYYVTQFDLSKLIADGVIESGVDHYQAIGQFGRSNGVKYQELITGTDGNDTLIGYGKFEVDFWGVGVEYISKDVTVDFGITLPPEITDKRLRRYESFGEGEIDTMISVPGIINEYILGSSINILYSQAQPFYLGQGDNDYALIKNIKRTSLGELVFSGDFANYTFEDKEKGLYAYYQNDLVAIFEDLKFSELGAREDYPTRGIFVYEYAPKGNEFYDTYIKPFFYEPLYPIVNPDVDGLIDIGLYESYYDHLIKAGQFEDREDTMFVGTSGNDVMSGIGAESILVGVAISNATYPPPDVKPVSTGVGEIDTLLGSSGENIFALGNGLLLNDTAESFYIGEGDNDYALIKNFDSTLDFITMAGLSSDYTFTAVDGNVHIAKDGDLIAIVEGDINLVAYPPSAEAGGFYVSGADNHELAQYNKAYFNEAFFLAQNPEAEEAIANGEYDSAFDYYLNNGGKLTATEGQQFTLWEGTEERDFVGAFGGDAGLIGVKIRDFEIKDGLPIALTTETNGTGERDFLYGAPGTNIFYLGTLGQNAESFYVGNGEEDYATIINFDRQEDYISLANDLADETIGFFSVYDKYTFTEVEGNTEIFTKEGDLIAVVEGATGLKPFTGYTPDGVTYLVSVENKFFDTYIKPSFFAPWYLELDASDYDNSVSKAIAEGLVTDPYDHYLKIGQFEAREDSVFAGDEGNSTVYGTGAEPVIIGVEVTAAVYARDNKPVTTGSGDVDTLIGSPGGDTFVLGHGTVINDAPEVYYVGEGDDDYALIKGLSGDSVTIPTPLYEDATIDRLFLAGRVYDYIFIKDGDNLKVSTRDGDLVAIVEDAPAMDTPFVVPGATYIYGLDTIKAFDNLWGVSENLYLPFYLAENPEVAELIATGEYTSAVDHYFQVGRFNPEGEAIFSGSGEDDFVVGLGNSDLLFGVELITVDGEKEGWISSNTGVGEEDFFIGGVGVTTYFIGNDNILDPSKGKEVYYVGEGDEDYAFIQNFDPYQDFIFAAGNFEDYTIKMVDDTQDVFGRIVPIKNLEIFYQEDLVAIVNNIGDSLTLPDGFTLQEFDFGEERPNGFAFVAPVNEFLPIDPVSYFNENVYLSIYPNVEKLIEKGKYESAYDHYLKIGEEKGKTAFLSGKLNANDNITAFSDNSLIFGVEVTDYDRDNRNFIATDLGVGQIDNLTGNEGKNRFVIGNNGQSFYVGGKEEDYANIYNFDPLVDSLVIAGDGSNYKYKTVAKDGLDNLEISTADGDLVAIIHDIDGDRFQLTPLPVNQNRFPNDTILASTLHPKIVKSLKSSFFAPVYSIQNPDVDALIAQGLYESYFDHFIQAGQFEEREDTFFAGTLDNDTMYAIGWETILSGVPITAAQYREGLDVVPSNLGSGQIDILYSDGGSGKETIFLLGNSNLLNPTAQSFYLGNGDADYALIKNFSPGDRLFLGSDVGGFTQTVVEGNLHIAKNGDLIAIVENRLELFSERANELTSLGTESYASGTNGNDIVFGNNRQSKIIGVPLANNDLNEVYAITTGTGEFDILNGSQRGDTFFLGIPTSPEGNPQPLYVGNGDADYALIQTFSTKELYDSVTLAGTIDNYKFEFEAYAGTGEDTKIYTKDGDLIGIVENVTLSQLYIEGSGSTLYASSLNGTAQEASEYLFDIEPFFYEEFYIDENPEVIDLIASGEYGSVFEHFLEIGQFAEESEIIFAGTEGDDFIPSIGKTDLVFGVPLTKVDGTVEGWEEATTGVGERDTLVGGLSVTTFFIGNDQILDPSKPNTVYYLGEGDEDYALIQGFQPTQDFIFGAGAIAEYSFANVDGDLKISYGSDLVAIIDDGGALTLQAFPLGEERPRGLVLVAPENEFLDGMG